jgi:hypothetical protein
MKFNRNLLKEKGNARMFFLDAKEITVSMEVACRRVIDNHLSIYSTILPYTNECRGVVMDSRGWMRVAGARSYHAVIRQL